ncbi:phosphate acyltransferase PlsX [Paenibacillus sp. MMS18-CY102]|uniref:phosphate acyltransferase PlsX n=1 Tax=Paenibacillus sp. MMS18-CY102 TaxID=2682849 RepID=UPI001365FD56|nr:phosphate acyltransferase PlsX [Paenibacillus sp. MMS18-CY102]
MRIAIDAMGGDHAPNLIVKGALDAAAQWTDIQVILVGDSAVIEPLLQGSMPSNVRIEHAEEVIGPDEEPVKAVRRKKRSSMVVAGQLVREGQADAMISAGNTGALMTTGLLVVGRMEGIERPALAQLIPTKNGVNVMALDLGANMDAKPEQLVQYAQLGSIYRSKVDGLTNPRVGLLNVGTEERKGNELTKAAYDLLEASSLNFIGNVESRDVLDHNCDVLVCDGFAGNIMLKAIEGTASSIMKTLKEEFNRSLLTKLAGAIMMPGLRNFRKTMDYKEHGGALLLGVNGLVVKGHGSSDALAIRNAIRQTRNALISNVTASMADEISRK